MKMPLLLFIVLASLIDGCKKPVTAITGGKGGNTTLVVTPIHLNLNVDSCTIYIKYAATDAPVTGIYDDSQKVALVDTIPEAIFTGLQEGEYYLYGNGYHAYYFALVKGGIPIKILSQGTVDVLLPTFAY